MKYRTTFVKSQAPNLRTVDEIGCYFGMTDEEMDKLEVDLKAHFAQPGAKPMTVKRKMYVLGPQYMLGAQMMIYGCAFTITKILGPGKCEVKNAAGEELTIVS